MYNVALFLKEKESIKTQQEAVSAIRRRLNELELTQAVEPEEMIDIVMKNGVAGSGTSQHSPLYLYDRETKILTLSYEHINFPYPLYAGLETYQIVTLN